jgi:hypothetical protein
MNSSFRWYDAAFAVSARTGADFNRTEDNAKNLGGDKLADLVMRSCHEMRKLTSKQVFDTACVVLGRPCRKRLMCRRIRTLNPAEPHFPRSHAPRKFSTLIHRTYQRPERVWEHVWGIGTTQNSNPTAPVS